MPRHVLLLVAGLFPCLCQAQIMLCIDKDGHKEYAQKCPEGTEQKDLRLYSGKGKTMTELPIAEQDAAFKERQMDRDLAEKNAAIDAKNKATACEAAREQIAQLQSGRALHYSTGSPQAGKELDAADRARETQAQQERVAQYCPH